MVAVVQVIDMEVAVVQATEKEQTKDLHHHHWVIGMGQPPHRVLEQVEILQVQAVVVDMVVRLRTQLHALLLQSMVKRTHIHLPPPDIRQQLLQAMVIVKTELLTECLHIKRKNEKPKSGT